MAKGKSAATPKAKKKAAKGVKASSARTDKKRKHAGGSAVDALWKIADHPLVGELIAIGATAAVAAIAQQDLGRSRKQGSAKTVKDAGKAAAAAIGARLISEYAGEKRAKKPKTAKA